MDAPTFPSALDTVPADRLSLGTAVAEPDRFSNQLLSAMLLLRYSTSKVSRL